MSGSGPSLPEGGGADPVRGFLGGSRVVHDDPSVGQPEHPSADLLELLGALEPLQLLSAGFDPSHGRHGVHVHEYPHVGRREDVGEYPVRHSGEIVGQVRHGHDVPHEHDIVESEGALHPPNGSDDVRHIERGGGDERGLPIDEKQPRLQPSEACRPVGMLDPQDLPALGFELIHENVRGGALARSVHPVHDIPGHAFTAPAAPWPRPRS